MVYCLLQPSLYFSQCWLIVNMNRRNILQSNLIKSTIIIFTTNAFQNTTRKMITISFRSQRINSVRPGNAYICHWNDSSFVQLMGWHLFGYTLLAEIILTYCQLDTFEQISVEFGSKNEKNLHTRKWTLKCHLQMFHLQLFDEPFYYECLKDLSKYKLLSSGCPVLREISGKFQYKPKPRNFVKVSDWTPRICFGSFHCHISQSFNWCTYFVLISHSIFCRRLLFLV